MAARKTPAAIFLPPDWGKDEERRKSSLFADMRAPAPRAYGNSECVNCANKGIKRRNKR